uniref:Uncharacterized protein n=1 Tax=Timema tahoe TaxID=61484 RepID=A0A7R9IHZ2_9NEOP|nr:unnamed protein product [Timema tahoe]
MVHYGNQAIIASKDLIRSKVEFRRSVPAFAWSQIGKPFKKTTLNSLDRDSNPNFPIISSPDYRKSNALDHSATEVVQAGNCPLNFIPELSKEQPVGNGGRPDMFYHDGTAADHVGKDSMLLRPKGAEREDWRLRPQSRLLVAPYYLSTPPSVITESEEIWPVAPFYSRTPLSDITESEEICPVAPSYPSTPPSDITESEEIWPVAPSYPSTPPSDITESEEIWPVAPFYSRTPLSDITESEKIWPVAPSYSRTPPSDITESEFIPTEIRTSISPSSAVELNTTSALANYAIEAELQGGPRKSSPPPISSRRLTLNWRRSIPFHPYCDMKNEQVNCLSKAQDGKVYAHLRGEREREREREGTIQDKPPSVHSDRDSNLNLPTIGSLAYCAISTLDHATTEAVLSLTTPQRIMQPDTTPNIKSEGTVALIEKSFIFALSLSQLTVAKSPRSQLCLKVVCWGKKELLAKSPSSLLCLKVVCWGKKELLAKSPRSQLCLKVVCWGMKELLAKSPSSQLCLKVVCWSGYYVPFMPTEPHYSLLAASTNQRCKTCLIFEGILTTQKRENDSAVSQKEPCCSLRYDLQYRLVDSIVALRHF